MFQSSESKSNRQTLANCSLVFIFASLAILSAGCEKEPAPEQRQPSLVKTSPVIQMDIAPRVALTGTVVPANVSRVATGVSGKVEMYNLKAGDFVAEGEVIAQLRVKTLEIQVAATQALANEKLQRWEEMKVGSRPEEIARAKAQLDAAQASFEIWMGNEAENDEGRLKRMQDAHTRGSITDSDFREAVSMHRQAQSLRDAAQAEYDLLANGFTTEQLAQAEAAYLALSEEVNRLQDERERLTIVAPFDGYITEKMAEVGEWISEGSPVATLVKLGEVDVITNIEEVSLPLARVGATVELRFDALPGESFTGTIEQIVPRADWRTGSRSFPLRIRVMNSITNGQPKLREGMLGRVIIKGDDYDALLVPKDAVSRGKGTPVVYALIGKESTDRMTMGQMQAEWDAGREVLCRVQPVDIVEGMAYDNDIDVLRGQLAATDVVVTDGVERLRAMQLVRVPPPETEKNAQASQQTSAGTKPVAKTQPVAQK